MQRKHKNKHRGNVHGNQNPQRLEDDRQQEVNRVGVKLPKKKKQPKPEAPVDTIWDNHFYLIMLGGVGLSVFVAAVVYAQYASANNSVAVLPVSREPYRKAVAPEPEPKPVAKQPPASSSPKMFHPVDNSVAHPVDPKDLHHVKGPIIKVRTQGLAHDVKSLAVFNGIYQLSIGSISLFDLLQIIKKNGKRSLNAVCDIDNIRDEWHTINATNVAPLHYAFLIGRVDAFALLLAEGATLDGEFCFESDKQTDVTISLTNVWYSPMHLFFAGRLCTPAVSHELFLAYLQRKDFDRAAEMMTYKLKETQARAMKWQTKINDQTALEIFSMLPTPEHIMLSMSDMTPGYREFLMNMYFEWLHWQRLAMNHHGGFSAYEPNAHLIVLNKISEYLMCFNDLLENIDKNIVRAAYEGRRTYRIILQYPQFPHSDLHKVCFDNLRTKIIDAVKRELGADVANDLAHIHFVLNFVSNLLPDGCTPMYRASYVEIVKQYLANYVGKHADVHLLGAVESLNKLKANAPVESIRIILGGVIQRINGLYESEMGLKSSSPSLRGGL